ncbi:MAG: geranylgeranylglyceryl/heptaprenylglyceryl phosphate synthase [Nitrososphaerales archaeon]|nr:geranylgeranylglyceryl/heptaprenylglyceryl phosphate synthase [Nitrososphaerales archaeon]
MKEFGPVESLIKKKASHHHTICAALIDPEDFTPKAAAEVAVSCIKAGASLILVGGSTIANQSQLDRIVRSIKSHVVSPKSQRKTPVVLFPGNITGVSRFADAILFSSLLNSTNTYYIIGAQALGAMEVFKSGLESIPMGYLVFGNTSSTSFIGQVNGLPATRPSLAVIYALAARYLGMRALYLEAGSGSSDPLPPATVHAVRKFYDGILIVGGGITTAEHARKIAESGADVLVIGNLLQTRGFEDALKRIVAAIKR